MPCAAHRHMTEKEFLEQILAEPFAAVDAQEAPEPPCRPCYQRVQQFRAAQTSFPAQVWALQRSAWLTALQQRLKDVQVSGAPATVLPLTRARTQQPPADIVRIVQRPPETWSPTDSEDLFTWVLNHCMEGLVRFAYGCLATYDPAATLDDAQEVVAEKLCDAWRFLYTFDPLSGSFLHWLYTMVRRHCRRIGLQTAQRRAVMAPLTLLDPDGQERPREVPDPVLSPETLQFTQESLACLQQCLDNLREPYRSAIRLAALEGQSSEAIAHMQGITPNNAKIRVFRARQMLRNCLRACLSAGEGEANA